MLKERQLNMSKRTIVLYFDFTKGIEYYQILVNKLNNSIRILNSQNDSVNIVLEFLDSDQVYRVLLSPQGPVVPVYISYPIGDEITKENRVRKLLEFAREQTKADRYTFHVYTGHIPHIGFVRNLLEELYQQFVNNDVVKWFAQHQGYDAPGEKSLLDLLPADLKGILPSPDMISIPDHHLSMKTFCQDLRHFNNAAGHAVNMLDSVVLYCCMGGSVECLYEFQDTGVAYVVGASNLIQNTLGQPTVDGYQCLKWIDELILDPGMVPAALCESVVSVCRTYFQVCSLSFQNDPGINLYCVSRMRDVVNCIDKLSGQFECLTNNGDGSGPSPIGVLDLAVQSVININAIPGLLIKSTSNPPEFIFSYVDINLWLNELGKVIASSHVEHSVRDKIIVLIEELQTALEAVLVKPLAECPHREYGSRSMLIGIPNFIDNKSSHFLADLEPYFNCTDRNRDGFDIYCQDAAPQLVEMLKGLVKTYSNQS